MTIDEFTSKRCKLRKIVIKKIDRTAPSHDNTPHLAIWPMGHYYHKQPHCQADKKETH